MASANVLRAVAIRRVSAYETDGGTWAGHGIALQSMLPALGNPQPMRCINSDMNPSLLAYRLSYVGATVDSYIAFGPAIDLLGRENDSSMGRLSAYTDNLHQQHTPTPSHASDALDIIHRLRTPRPSPPRDHQPIPEPWARKS
ncbi:hypothetical protein CIB48_g5349 [Xylaria polymorpha]|nr:hypothetical protein CIB48_g5349 [Xylaria polymorpha]